MNDDLISRQAVIETTVKKNSVWNTITNASGDNLEQIINSVPAADVVEVVRCKDCKYGEVDDADFPNQYLCHHHGSAWNEGNHFCSYGERADT